MLSLPAAILLLLLACTGADELPAAQSDGDAAVSSEIAPASSWVGVFPDATHPMFVLPRTVEGISQDLLIPNLARYDFAPGYMGELREWLRRVVKVGADGASTF